MMRSCAETDSSSSLVDVTSTDFGVAFLRSPHNCLALARVRHAGCEQLQDKGHTDGDVVVRVTGEIVECWLGHKARSKKQDFPSGEYPCSQGNCTFQHPFLCRAVQCDSGRQEFDRSSRFRNSNFPNLHSPNPQKSTEFPPDISGGTKHVPQTEAAAAHKNIPANPHPSNHRPLLHSPASFQPVDHAVPLF